MTTMAFLGTKLPIIQAPLAGVQDVDMAIAVAQAGGLGSIPCGMLSDEEIVRQVEQFRSQLAAPINLNFTCAAEPQRDPQQEEQWSALLQPYLHQYGLQDVPLIATSNRKTFNVDSLTVIKQLKPEVVSFHFGLPAPALFQQVQALGCTTLCSATTLAEAQWLEAQGVSAIIAQGLEAGGHRGHFLSQDLSLQLGTFSLVKQIADQVRVPVIAAGGINDPVTVKAAMGLGASAVQVGTAYLLCNESKASPLHREAIQDTSRPTAITNLLSGRPARGIVNRIMAELNPIQSCVPPYPLPSGIMSQLKQRAEAKGQADFSLLWAGQDRTQCATVSARALTERIMGA